MSPSQHVETLKSQTLKISFVVYGSGPIWSYDPPGLRDLELNE